MGMLGLSCGTQALPGQALFTEVALRPLAALTGILTVMPAAAITV